jgi:hypothetical protein
VAPAGAAAACDPVRRWKSAALHPLNDFPRPRTQGANNSGVSLFDLNSTMNAKLFTFLAVVGTQVLALAAVVVVLR